MKTTCTYCGKTLERRPCRIKKRNYCNARHQLLFEYKHGIRDPIKITNACHKANLGQRKPRIQKTGEPTKYEQYFIEIVKKYNLPFEYCGNGGVIINGLNPDFIHNTKKKVIEVWTGTKHKEREKIYKQAEYECLFVYIRHMALKTKTIEEIINFSDAPPILEANP